MFLFKDGNVILFCVEMQATTGRYVYHLLASDFNDARRVAMEHWYGLYKGREKQMPSIKVTSISVVDSFIGGNDK